MADSAPSTQMSLPNPGSSDTAHWQRGFWSLIATQFQTGFNDNAIKFLVIYIVVAMNFPQAQRDFLVLIIGAMFALPFILFSLTGGYFADRYSKRSVTIGTKILEFAVLGFFILALYLRNIPMECASVFLISVEGALFGPSKYGLLPELLPEPRLSWGNGIIELGTFACSIGATMAAGILAQRYHGRETVAGFILLAFACVGLATSFGISRVPAADPHREFRRNPLRDLGTEFRTIRADKILSWAVLGNTYLWFLAALLQFTIVIYGHDILRADDTHISYLQAAVGIGIGIGSFAAGYLSGGKIEYGLIPIGAVGMTVFGALLYSPGHSVRTAGIHLAWLGFFGGFFAVPLNALIQHRPRPERKGGVIAAANLLSFVGVFAAAGAYYLFASGFHQSAAAIFLDGAVLTFLTTAFSIYLLPDSLVRLGAWLATQFVYRIHVEGRDNIPETGGALLVANHVSFIDAILIIASTERPIRFLIDADIHNIPFVKPFVKLARTIPIPTVGKPREKIRALRAAADAIRSGELVCIFAEGQITRIGQTLRFHNGMQRILRGLDAPIVPVGLDGLWGSIFSFERGRFFWKWPHGILQRVTVSFGAAMRSTAEPYEVREAVQRLQTEAFSQRKRRMDTLHHSLIRTAHRSPFRFAMGDKRRPRMKWAGVLLSAIFLARRLRTTWEGQQMVGILLPPSVPAALVNFAAMLAGKIPVNLNYTSSGEVLASCTAQCNLQTVITTKLLLDHIPLKVPGRTILLEQAAAAPTLAEKIAALLIWFLPAAWIERVLAGSAPKSIDDLAAVIFTSGSTGDPKGVMLTHFNIASNIEQATQVFTFTKQDCLLGILPFFHSFGSTITLWLPAFLGVGVVYHPSPVDSHAVGELVRDYRVTFLLATPTFLQTYTRRCSPEDFKSLRIVIAGAEKLPDRIASAFEERFHLRPLEGYGVTECSPVVAANSLDFSASGIHQYGAKPGSIGRPLPGVSVRIVDPDSFDEQPLESPGLLLVRGPNVMKGYLGKPEATAAVLNDGWYNTGDIASQDDDGFLTITDRLGRFSKIGGEMVPHVRIEEHLQLLAGDSDEPRFAVTAVPDDNKGERLVVLHTLSGDELRGTLEKLSHSELPHLWTPRPNQFFQVDELPRLGTGKIDLRLVREMAADFSPQLRESV